MFILQKVGRQQTQQKFGSQTQGKRYFVIITPNRDNMKFDLFISLCFLIGYIQTFIGATEGVFNNRYLSNLEWYFVYTFIGISMILWCLHSL